MNFSKTTYLICFLVITLVTQNSKLQAQVQWDTIYTSSGIIDGYAVQATRDNGYVVVGFSNLTSTIGGQDVCVVKLNNDGSVKWSNNYGDNSTDYGLNIIETADSGYVVVGILGSFTTSSSDAYIFKLDKNGNMLWHKEFGGPEHNAAWDVVEIPTDSGLAVVTHADYYTRLIRMSQFGDTLWTQLYTTDSIRMYSIDYCASDGGFVMAGVTTVSAAIQNGHVIKTDFFGNLEWSYEYFGNNGEGLYDVLVTPSNEIFAIGSSLVDSQPIFTRGVVRKLDINGNQIDYNTYFVGKQDVLYGMCYDEGFLVLAGYTVQDNFPNINDTKAYTLKINEALEVIWEEFYGESMPINQSLRSVCKSHDGGYLFSGLKSNSQIPITGLYLYKVGENGNLLSFPEITIEVPNFLVYPNPAIDYFFIQYQSSLFPESEVTIAIYNSLGQMISTPINLNANEVRIDCSNWTSGAYIINFTLNNATFSKKLLIRGLL
jgi:hypothetical protein